MNLFDVYPLFDITIDRGEGAKVWDDKGEEYLESFPSYESIRDAGDASFSMRVWQTASGKEKVISYTGSTDICILPQYTVYFVVHPDGSYKAFTSRWYLGRIMNGSEK